MQIIGFIVVMGIIIYLHVMNGWNQSRLNDLSDENISLYKRLHDTQERESEAWNKYDKLKKTLHDFDIKGSLKHLISDIETIEEIMYPSKKAKVDTKTARQTALDVHEETEELLRREMKDHLEGEY